MKNRVLTIIAMLLLLALAVPAVADTFPVEATIGDCVFRITGLTWVSRIGYYQAGRHDVGGTGDYYDAGDGRFVVLWADIFNYSGSNVDFLAGCDVKVYERANNDSADYLNVYEGWAAQQNYGNLTMTDVAYGEDSGLQNKRWIISPADEFEIADQNEGHYAFICELSSGVYNGSTALDMEVAVSGGRAFTYPVRRVNRVDFGSVAATTPTPTPVPADSFFLPDLAPEAAATTPTPMPTAVPTATPAPAQQYVAGVTGDSYIRSGPGLGYSVLGSLIKGYGANYLNQSSVDDRGVAWYRIEYHGMEAWVSSRYTELRNGTWTGRTGPVTTSKPASSSSSSGSYVKATGGRSNLRSGPGLSYDDVGTLQRGETATYLGESSVDSRGVRWYKVSYNGKKCWVSSKYTTLY